MDMIFKFAISSISLVALIATLSFVTYRLSAFYRPRRPIGLVQVVIAVYVVVILAEAAAIVLSESHGYYGHYKRYIASAPWSIICADLLENAMPESSRREMTALVSVGLLLVETIPNILLILILGRFFPRRATANGSAGLSS